MKIKHIFGAIPAFAIALAFVACSKTDVYTPAEREDDSKVVVYADLTSPRSLEADGTDFQVPLVRTSGAGDLEVSVTLDDASGIFSLKNPTIKFANGETKTYATVSYSYDALVPETQYGFAVRVTSEEYTSEYRPKAAPITCVKAWQNLGAAQFYDDWWIGGPFEKTLLKSPDGTEKYRLVDPWDKASIEKQGFVSTGGLPYLEFTIEEDGSISYSHLINLGFTYSDMTCHFLHPAEQDDAESAALNKMVMDKVAQFCWYPILAYNKGSFRWWGTTSVAYISFPGGPDLKKLL